MTGFMPALFLARVYAEMVMVRGIMYVFWFVDCSREVSG